MFKEQKTNIFVSSILAVLVISLITPVAKAELNIGWIAITSYKEHVDGTPKGTEPWRFEIWVENEDPGSLDHIDVTPPSPATPFTIFEYYGFWEWEATSWYSSLADLRVDYPEGIYTFDFRNISDILLDTVSLNYSGLPGEPSNPVNFTNPSVNGQFGISITPTITWTVDAGAGDTLMMLLEDNVTGESYWDAPVSMTTSSWTPGTLQSGRGHELEVTVLEVKDWVGPDWPTATTTGGDLFACCLMIEYLNEINFTTMPAIGTLSGLIFIPPGVPDIGYSLDEGDLLYFYSSVPVLNYNFTTGQWDTEGPKGLIFANWPFIYELDTGTLWFALPPVSGLWVYHFSTGQWEVLPRIIP